MSARIVCQLYLHSDFSLHGQAPQGVSNSEPLPIVIWFTPRLCGVVCALSLYILFRSPIVGLPPPIRLSRGGVRFNLGETRPWRGGVDVDSLMQTSEDASAVSCEQNHFTTSTVQGTEPVDVTSDVLAGKASWRWRGRWCGMIYRVCAVRPSLCNVCGRRDSTGGWSRKKRKRKRRRRQG